METAIRKQITIDLTEYGYKGEIVLEELNAKKHYELKNRLGACLVTDPKTGAVHQLKGDMDVYTILAYVTRAPFIGSNNVSKEDWYKFLDRMPMDMGLKLATRILKEVESFAWYQSQIGPLEQSGEETPAEDGTSTSAE